MRLPGQDLLRAWLEDPDRVRTTDRALLHLDDPTNPMIVNALVVLREPLTIDELREVIRTRFAEIPRMGQSVDARPAWERWRDDHVDLDRHIHELTLPEPGSEAQLRDLVSGLIPRLLPGARPLWEVHLIHGYRGHEGEGPASAVVFRVHHSLGDGLALLLVLLAMTDAAPDAEPNPLFELFASRGTRALDEARKFIREIMPTGMKLMLRRDLLALDESRERRRRSIVDRTKRTVNFAGAFVTSLADLATRRPDSSTVVRGPLGVHKRVAWSGGVELARVRAHARTLEATVNDIVLSAMAGGLRRYLIERGESPAGVEMRAVVPINLRTLAEMAKLGNRFGMVFVTLPVGISGAEARLVDLKRQMDALKHSVEPLLSAGLLGLVGASPELIERLAVFYFADRISLVMTNVPGPECTLYFGGREIDDVMFWVPAAGGVGLGVGIFSYAGRLRISVLGDQHLVPDPERLVENFEAELEAMLG